MPRLGSVSIFVLIAAAAVAAPQEEAPPRTSPTDAVSHEPHVDNLIRSGRSERSAEVVDDHLPALMEKHHVPGVSVAFVRGGEVAWHREFGVRRAGNPEKVTEDTVFEACSMTKPLVTYAALKLVESEVLDLDKPLIGYLDEPYLRDEPLHERITARMVLAHTSGFPNWREGGWDAGGPLHVEFEPGTKFGYSGEGFMYLQHVLEHLLKKPLDVFVKKSLLDPTGMKSSSLVWRDGYERLAAAGHDERGAVLADGSRFPRPGAAYSLFCTPTDYARFLIEVMKEDRSAPHSLSEKTVREMLSPRTVIPDQTAWVGLGWMLKPAEGADRVLHSGNNHTGFRCHAEFYPQSGSGIVVMANATGGGDLIAELMAKLLESSAVD